MKDFAVKWRIVAVLLAVLGIMLLTGAAFLAYRAFQAQRSGQIGEDPSWQSSAIRPGNPAPDFTLTSLSGEQISLAGLAGKPVLLNFWATWCPPCKDEMPLLQEYSIRYAGKFTILAVDYGEKESEVRPFIEELNLDFPIFLDPGDEVNTLYQVQGYPTTYFIGADGSIVDVHIGLLSETKLKAYLKDLGVVN